MAEIPRLGQTVRYVSKNADGIISPAMVIRTLASCVPLEEHKDGPHKPIAFQQDPGTVRIPANPDTEYHVDLLVHGLAGDYREYNVPFFNPAALFDPRPDGPGQVGAETRRKAAAGTWHWPTDGERL